MCQGPLHRFLADLPKCELHIHIEGSLSPELLFQLSERNKVPLPDEPSYASPQALRERYERFTSLDDFLGYYYTAMGALKTTADYEALAYEYFSKAHSDGVVHAEVFFDPQVHAQNGVAYQDIIDGFTAARRRAEADFGISSHLLMCFLRDLSAESAHATFTQADQLGHFADGTLHGIGLDSSEIGNPASKFADIYAAARAKGIHRTAHAAEEADPAYVADALDACQVERIDHGIRLAEDPALMARVAREQVLLTMCPISNVKLRCVKAIADLPIRQFLQHGVKFCLNSDDPSYFGGYILDNFCAVQDAFSLTVEEWEGIAKDAVIGSWASAERKQQILERIDVTVVQFREKALLQ